MIHKIYVICFPVLIWTCLCYSSVNAANCCLSGTCSACTSVLPTPHSCGYSANSCASCGGDYCAEEPQVEQLKPALKQSQGSICCYNAKSSNDICGTCQSFASGQNWCTRNEKSCTNNCAGTWCPAASNMPPMPSPTPAEDNRCCLYATSRNDVCGSCKSAATGQEWCAATEKRCVSSCSGTWCPAGAAKETPIPSSSPAGNSACCFYATSRNDVCGTCQSAATGQEWCASSQERCTDSCAGTWCGEGTPFMTTAPPSLNTTIATGTSNTLLNPSSSSSSTPMAVQSTTKSTTTVASVTSSKPTTGSSTQTTKSPNWIEGTYVTGYWDCCKPSCSWPNKGSVSAPVRACKSDGTTANPMDVSVCLGGVSASCADNQPWQASETLSFGFAAAAVSGSHGLSGDNNCGQCYELQFTSEIHLNGNWGGAHPNLVGKSHVVQVTNIGYDVSGEHSFDLQIPGAGQGIFTSGCTRQFLGKASGDFDCNNNFGGCNDISGCARLPAVLQPGCQWRYNFFKWLIANGKSNNPYVRFRRVRCPTELTNITGSVPLDDNLFPTV